MPLEYIWYDSKSGSHMDRPVFRRIMNDYIKTRKVAGVIFPKLERLTRVPEHLAEYERRCEHYGVRYWYCDMLSNGTDKMSKMMRQQFAQMAEWVLFANKQGNRGGRIGMALKGNVPPGPTPTGYKYASETRAGKVIRSWLELDGARQGAILPDGVRVWQLQDETALSLYFEEGTPAYMAALVFYLTVCKRMSGLAIAKELTARGYKGRNGGAIAQNTVREMLTNPKYYGRGHYNTMKWVANPKHDLPDDITSEAKRTIRRPTPDNEHVYFEVPALIDEETYKRAQEVTHLIRPPSK